MQANEVKAIGSIYLYNMLQVQTEECLGLPAPVGVRFQGGLRGAAYPGRLPRASRAQRGADHGGDRFG